MPSVPRRWRVAPARSRRTVAVRPRRWGTTPALLATLALLCFPRPGRALDPSIPVTQYLHETWSGDTDAFQGLVHEITQTKDGYLWFSRDGGVVRFDGVSFKVFSKKNVPEMTNTAIQAIMGAPDGSLWIAMPGCTALRYSGGVFQRFDSSNGLPQCNGSPSFFATRAGEMWIRTDRGLTRYDNGSFKPLGPESGLNGPIQALTETRAGLLVATSEGLRRWSDGRSVPVPLDEASRALLAQRPVSRMITLNDDSVLMSGGQTGVMRLNGETIRLIPATAQQTISSMIEDRAGNVWLGVNSALARLRDDRLEIFGNAQGFVGRNEVWAIFEDREGSLWIVSNEGTINRLQDPKLVTLTHRDGLIDDFVRTVWVDRDGSLWAGTASGVTHFQGKRATSYTTKDGLAGDLVVGITQDGAGNVWFACFRKGISVYRNGRFETVSRLGPRAVYTAPDGSVLLEAQEGGVDRYRDAKLVEHIPGPSGTDWIHQDRRGVVWLGFTASGVCELQRSGPRCYTTADGLSSNYVRTIHEDDQGVLWIGTKGGGLNWLKDGRWGVIKEEQGMEANVLQILDDGLGKFWFSNSAGIFSVSKDELRRVMEGKVAKVQTTRYTVRDGLRSNNASGSFQPSGARSRDGQLWFPTAKGVVHVDPTRVVKNELAPPVVIESIVADGTPRPLAQEVIVPPGEGKLEIRFTALSLRAPERMGFKYKLEPYDKGWVDSGGQRVAFYAGLAPRSYRFQVIASNDDGVWNNDGATVTVRLRKHFYQTWWFYLAMMLLGGGLAYAVYYWRVSALKAHQVELARKVEERTADLHQEIGEHKRTGQQLQDQMAERERAQAELSRSNTELIDKQRELKRENEERKRAEEAARQAGEAAGRERDLLHALMDNIPDLIYFKDTEGRYTRINRAHADAFGLAAVEQAAGRSDDDFYAPDFVRRGREEERNLMTSGRASVGRADFDARSGRWFLATKVPLRDKSGKLTGLVGISKDITERKQTEEKLEADLQAFLAVVDAVAQGDLTRRGTQAEDTLGRIARSVNKMLDNFCTILSGVRGAVFSVSSSSSQILAAATQIAKGAQYGSDEVHNTSSAVDEMAASMTLVSQHADQSAAMARQVLEYVHEGEHSVNVTVLGMTRIDTATSETAEKMRLLEQRSKQIFDIVALIEEIASQSTLLSLNAAIEAAHAGDAGRGFAVVAEEIRRLADRSRESTKQVTAIVEGIVEETRLVLAAMENGTREVHSGHELSEQAQKSLEQIQDLAEHSVALSEQISHASREQAQATQMVSQAMQTISNITLESSAGATEASKAVKDLVRLSEELTRAISRFQIGTDS